MKSPRILLDSGAFSAERRKITIDIDEYAEFIKTRTSEYEGRFNLDVIGDGERSYQNWKYLQSKGVDTIPVYHLNTDEKYLRSYLSETDYVAIGAVANMDTSQRLLGLDHVWKTHFIDKKGFAKVKVHGLGLTAIPILVRYPWFSVDSFTPIISAVWGSIMLPKLRTINSELVLDYSDLLIACTSDQGKMTTGSYSVYANLPKRARDLYGGLMDDLGFTLGDSHYQTIKHPRYKRVKGIKERTFRPMFDMVEPSDATENGIITLANSWEERMRWNLTIWNRVRDRLPILPRPMDTPIPSMIEPTKGDRTRMYMGMATKVHMRAYSVVLPKFDILISYAYWSEPISKTITQYLDRHGD